MTKKLSDLLKESTSDDLHVLLAHVTELSFNALPESYKGTSEYNAFTVQVVYRGKDLWAVVDREGALNRKGESSYEPQPSSRTQRYLKSHRFTLAEAVKIAEKAQHTVTCWDRTATEWVAWKEAKK